MKTIILLCLCFNLWADDLRLICRPEAILANLTNLLELYGSDDLKHWHFVANFTNSIAVFTNHFYRARAKPPPPSIILVAPPMEGTLARLFGTSTKPLSRLWLTNGTQVIEGRMTRQRLQEDCDWEFPAFNLEGGVAHCSFTDLDGNTVRTNWDCIPRPGNPLQISYPVNNEEVIGQSVVVNGVIDRLDAEVWVDTGSAMYPATIRNGEFLTAAIPVAASNQWTLHCLDSYYGETLKTISFTRSPVTITYSVDDWTRLYGERGIIISGTVSDGNYDVVIGDYHLSTTNRTWKARITPPKNGLLRFKVVPKQSSFLNTAGAAGAEGLLAMDYPPMVFACSSIMSKNYYCPQQQIVRTALSEFAGWNQTNRIFSRTRDGRIEKDCSITFSGLGEYLLWESEVGQGCSVSTHRTLFPSQYAGHQVLESSLDTLGLNASSTARANVGGIPNDPKKYKITMDLALFPIEFREADEVYCSFSPVSSKGWKMGGQECPRVFESYSQQEVDCTPTPPVMNEGYYYYEVVFWKEALP